MMVLAVLTHTHTHTCLCMCARGHSTTAATASLPWPFASAPSVWVSLGQEALLVLPSADEYEYLGDACIILISC